MGRKCWPAWRPSATGRVTIVATRIPPMLGRSMRFLRHVVAATVPANLHGLAATVRYNIHMPFEEDDFPLPYEQYPQQQSAEDQFDDDLMRALTERLLRKPKSRPSYPQRSNPT